MAVRASSSAATPAKAPEKIEVFVDDQSVLVEPGTTVLQVSMHFKHQFHGTFLTISMQSNDRLPHKLALKFHAFVIMNDWPLLAIVACVWLKWRKVRNQLLLALCL